MAQLASDGFNRADNASAGASWTTKRGDTTGAGGSGPSIVSNQAAVPSTGTDHLAYYNAVSWPTDGYAQATSVLAGANVKTMCVGYRMSTALDRTGYYGGYDGANFGDGLKRTFLWNGATQTPIASAGSSVAANDVVKLQVSGSLVSLFINGADAGIGTSNATLSGAAGNNAGLNLNGSAINQDLADDFSGGDLGSLIAPKLRPPLMIFQRPSIGFNSLGANARVQGVPFLVDGNRGISPLASATPRMVTLRRLAKMPTIVPAVATVAAGPFAATLSAALFTFTPQAPTRLNAFLAALSSAVFTFTANALTRLTTVATTLSSAVFTFTPQALTRLNALVTTLSSAVFTFTPKALTRLTTVANTLSSALFTFTPQALTRISAYAAQFTSAVFQFVPAALTYTVGAITAVSDWVIRARRRRR